MEQIGCSVEKEPRTLFPAELNCARETAINIVQKKEPEEASRIFTKGMRTVISIEEMEKKIERRELIDRLDELKEGVEVFNKSWDFPCPPTNLEEFPDKSNIRESLSAPF